MSTDIEALNPSLEGLGRYEYGWSDTDTAGATARGRPRRDADRGFDRAAARPA